MSPTNFTSPARQNVGGHGCNFAFGQVDFELELGFQMPRDGSHHPLCSAFAFDKNHHVEYSGITCKAVSPPLQLNVQLVQQDVCQEWR